MMQDRDTLDMLELIPVLASMGITHERFREVDLPGAWQLVAVYPGNRSLEELRLTFGTKKERAAFIANMMVKGV